MKLYTKSGDHGLTGLIGGTRIRKSDARIEAYGTIDELNSFIGMLITYDLPEIDRAFLRTIQNLLFVVGSNLATDRDKVELQNASVLNADHIAKIEEEIDRLDLLLPELTAFILPGGNSAASFSHICRAVARRAERRIVELDACLSVDNQVIVFVNRLSDYFFALSRFLNVEKGDKEIYWKI